MHYRSPLSAGLLAAILITGCATRTTPKHTVPVSPLHSIELGKIGIIATSTVPSLSWQLPLTKAFAGEKYGREGFDLGISDPESARALVRGTVGLVLPIMFSASIVGNVMGTVRAAKKTQFDSADAAVFATVRETEPQEALRAEVFRWAARARGNFVVVKKPFPPGEEHEYRRMASMMCSTLASLPPVQKPMAYLRSQGINTALEIELQKTSLESDRGLINPAMRLTIAGVSRVIDVQTGHQLSSRAFSYVSAKHKFVTWGERNAVLLRKELDEAYKKVSRQILDQFTSDLIVDQNGELMTANVKTPMAPFRCQ